jgi:Holliday junction resolvase
MLAYAKGASFERSLKKELQVKGFVVVRAAGSGVDSENPDLIALSSTKKMAFECKAWENNLRIEAEKFAKMDEWQKKTAIPIFIAWKKNYKEWKFLPLQMLKKTDSNAFSANLDDFEIAMRFEDLLL